MPSASSTTQQRLTPEPALTHQGSTPPISAAGSVAPSSVTLPSFITASSLSGDYVRVVVQLTKDHIPVVFANWFVPFEGLDLAVSDLTYSQYCQVGEKLLEKHRSDFSKQLKDCPITGNSMIIQKLSNNPSFLSLKQVLKVTSGPNMLLRTEADTVFVRVCHLVWECTSNSNIHLCGKWACTPSQILRIETPLLMLSSNAFTNTSDHYLPTPLLPVYSSLHLILLYVLSLIGNNQIVSILDAE